MQRVSLDELSESVRAFLARAAEGQGIVIQDDAGRARYGVIPFRESTAAEKAAAWTTIETVQGRVATALREAGVDPADSERATLVN